MPYAEIKYEDIWFDPAVQKLCVSEKYACPFYGHSWACPPAAPFMKQGLARFRKFYVIFFEVNLDDYVKEKRVKRPQWSEEKIRNDLFTSRLMLDGFKQELTAFLESYQEPYAKKRVFWSGGSCDLCDNSKDLGCCYDAGFPCRHPDEIHYSMESVGILLHETVKKAGIKMEWPPVHRVYKVGLVAFK